MECMTKQKKMSKRKMTAHNLNRKNSCKRIKQIYLSQEYKDGIIEKAFKVIKGVAYQTGLIST